MGILAVRLLGKTGWWGRECTRPETGKPKVIIAFFGLGM